MGTYLSGTHRSGTVSGWALVRERARVSDTIVSACAVLLALVCLIPLFADLSWVLPSVAVVVIVATLGAASRAIALPIPFVPLVELVGIVGTLTAIFASDQAYGKVFPTTESWDVLRALASQGMLDAQAFSAPVPTIPDLILLAVGGAGLAALCVDTLFVSVRSALLAGVPIFVLFIGSSVLQFGRAPWWMFPPAAIGWLLILAADQRDAIRDWGRVAPTTRIRGLSTVARRVGAVAIAVALVAGVVLPVRAMTGLSGSGDGSGGGSAEEGGPIILDPLVSMRRNLTLSNDSEVIRYRTDSPQPSYLRVTALETFDGVTWRQRPGLESGRDPGWDLPGIVESAPEGSTTTYDISVTNLENAYLPLPYPIASVENVDGIDTGWHLDPATGVAFSTDLAATGNNYRATAIETTVKASDLRGAPLPRGTLWPQLSLPNSVSPMVRQTAQEVTKGADTPYDKAVALQKWFTRDGGFRYSTSVRSGSDLDYITEFLNDRVGYCEQFAGAMAIMARTLGIPSRVVVGFTQGSQEDDLSWKVTVRDAHAWPELWFDGVGWVRFEPTPRSDATVRAPDYAPITNQVPDGSSTNADDRRLRSDLEGLDGVPIDRGTDYRGIANRLAVALVLLVGLVVLALPMARRIVRRRQRLHSRDYASVAVGAWEEIGATAIDLGQPWSMFSTPRQAAERLTRGMSERPAGALRRLRIQVEQVRYAPTVVSGTGASAALDERSAAVRADVRVVVRELRGRVRWQVRLQAYCWPSSERRRQRSSMRSMNPDDLRERGADSVAGAAVSSAGRTWKAE